MNENVIMNTISDVTLAEEALIAPFKEAIDKVVNSTAETIKVNKAALSELYNIYYENNRALLFKMFQVNENGVCVLDLKQQEVLFDSIEVKQKCNLYNTISVEARPFVI